MGAGLITLMKEQLARARKQEEASVLEPLEIFLAAPPPHSLSLEEIKPEL